MSYTCPKCERGLLREGQWHYCAKISLDSLFKSTHPDLILVFDKILGEVADWDGVLVSTTHNCVVFVHRRTFLVIKPKKKELDIKFYSKEMLQNNLIAKSTLYGKKYENHIPLIHLSQLNPSLFDYLRKSYQLL